MSMFWIAGGLFVSAALFFVLPPLLQPAVEDGRRRRLSLNLGLYRERLDQIDADQAAGRVSTADAAQARREVEREMHEDAAVPEQTAAPPRPAWRTAAVVGLLVPAAALLLYRGLGDPRGLADPAVAPSAAADGPRHAMDRAQIAAMVDGLARRLEMAPQDLDGWIMLGRSLTTLGRYEEAARAYGRAVALQPESATLLADQADTLAMARGRRLAGEPLVLVRRALELDPRHLKALSLAASAEFEGGNNAAAVAYWERMAQLVPADSRLGQSVRANITEATGGKRALAGAPAAAPQKALHGTLRLADSLRGAVRPDDTVFVFARATDGSRMPVAIRRLRVADLPAQFVLDDSTAMGGASLSALNAVMLGARVSRSGEAAARKGDPVAAPRQVEVGGGTVEIVIDRLQE